MIIEDLYIRRQGWYHRLDPRTKMGLTLLFVAASAILDAPAPMLMLLILLHVCALTSAIPWRRIGDAWRALLPITLFITFLSSITWRAAGPTLVQLGPLTITGQSLRTSLTMALRVDALAFSFLALLWCTEQGELVAGLTRLGLPHSASLTLVIAMQFVPTFGRIYGEIMEAQQSRGLIMPRGNPIAIGRAHLPVMVPLFISALRMVDHLSMALAARGYGAGGRRTIRRQLKLSRADWAALAGGVVLVALAVLLRTP